MLLYFIPTILKIFIYRRTRIKCKDEHCPAVGKRVMGAVLKSECLTYSEPLQRETSLGSPT